MKKSKGRKSKKEQLVNTSNLRSNLWEHLGSVYVSGRPLTVLRYGKPFVRIVPVDA